MNNIFLALSLAALGISAARAQPETAAFGTEAFAQAEEAVRPMAPVDVFAGVSECSTLDAQPLRPWSLSEALDLAKPCLQAVAARRGDSLELVPGLQPASAAGETVNPDLILKTDIAPGTKAHRDLAFSLERRRGRLFGFPVKLLTRGEVAPSAVSAVQDALKQCVTTDVVREIRTGADFVEIYGSCLTGNPSLKIAAIRPASGLAVDLTTEQDPQSVRALDGFVTVNAGMGPVIVMINASSAPAPLL